MILDTAYTGFTDPTWELNPMQEDLAPLMDLEGINLVLSAPTASGKSTAISMFGKKHLDNGKAILYLGTMKALVEEKYNDWTDPAHPWAERPKSIVTGDYFFDDAKIEELKKADLIVMTPESLCSKLRNSKSKEWVPRIGMIVVDEGHLVGQEGRGANLEAGLIEFVTENPGVQIQLLSATIPNVEDFKLWLDKLSDNKTIVVVSDYRPVKLKYHFLSYAKNKAYVSENERIQMVMEKVMTKADQQFMVVVFKKTFGYRIQKELEKAGQTVVFHHASKVKAERNSIVRQFEDGQARIVICTTTLTTGTNLPARNVIVTADWAGGKLLDTFDIQQAAGRAGRPKYDTEGDAYIFVQRDDNYYKRVEEIRNGEHIYSTLNKVGALAAHFLGALYLERFDTEVGFSTWYKKTLANAQNDYTEAELDEYVTSKIVKDMSTRGMTRVKDDVITLTNRGKITAQYLINPYYAFQLIMNLGRTFMLKQADDQDFAVALGSTDPYYSYVVRDELARMPKKVARAGNYARGCFVYYCRLRGNPIPPYLSSVSYQVYDDIERVTQALIRYDAEGERWNREEFLRNLCVRIKYSCSETDADFKMRKLTKSDQRNLSRHGLQTYDELVKNKTIASKALSKKRLRELNLDE